MAPRAYRSLALALGVLAGIGFVWWSLGRKPSTLPASRNLADIARQRGDEAGAERDIQKALVCDPKNAFAHHAFGLSQVRRREPHLALVNLGKTVELTRSNIRFA